MENSETGNHAIKMYELFEIWRKEKSKEKKYDSLFKHVVEKIGAKDVCKDYAKYLKEKIRLYSMHLDAKWNKCHRKLEVFRSQNNSWLMTDINFEIKKTSTKSSSSTVGRPCIPFGDKSEFGKRKQAAELSAITGNETYLLVRAAAASARKQGDVDLAAVLKESTQSPARASKIKKKCMYSDKEPIKFSADEALAFLLENNFTKDQYNAIRRESKLRNCNIYPHYNEVSAAKLKCRPDCIEVSERMARVSLQSVVSHTAKRIVEMQKEVFEVAMETQKTNFLTSELILSYGFDSSTGQAQFKQVLNEPSTSKYSESSLLATTIIPLRLVLPCGKPVWNNRTPQSVRFCRPIKLEYVKETKAVILEEDLDLKKQVDGLENLLITIGEGKSVEISFKLYLTLIDGKVLNFLTGTASNQACPICGSTPKDFMNISIYDSEKFRGKESNFKFGLSPLHCWIRFFEFILHVGYKLEVKKWQIRAGVDKLAVSKRKETIQNAFWRELGLRVDQPKVGGSGSTNDGNTARRAFTEHAIFGDITGVDQNLIFRFKTILICLSCQLPLNSSKFEMFCFQTAEIIQKLYYWLPMTPTVHKVLIHSKQIIGNTTLPIGLLGEDAAESRHRIYKADRLHHARKNSRVNNLADVFNRATDTSDPLISSKYLSRRMQQQKHNQLPPEVIELLSVDNPTEVLQPDEYFEKNYTFDEDNENDGHEQPFFDSTSVNILNELCLENEFDLTDLSF